MSDIQTESADGIQPGMLQSGASIQPVDGGEIRMVAIADLRESPWNPRQYYPEAAMAELTESMRQSGFRAWLPIVARPVGGGSIENSIFEIAAGHRRSRAARDAGIEFVPCIVRPMSDVEFLDVLNFDNCGREDVHPLHEAAGWVAWMEKTGHGVNDIAARIGQSKEYVYQRLKYSALIEPARKAFLDGEITAGHAILIARLQPADQKNALKACEAPSWSPHQRPSVRDLVNFIQRDVHLSMGQAKFDLSDETLLAAAGTCAACPKRTCNSPELRLETAHSDDECTDPGCFNTKLGNHLIRIKKAIEDTGEKVIEVSMSYGKVKKGVINQDGFQQASEATNSAIKAVVVDGYNAGSVVYVKLRSAPAASGSAKEDAAERERAASEQQAAIDRERAVRIKILEEIRLQVSCLLREDVRELLQDVLRETSFESAPALCSFRGIELSGVGDHLAAEALELALPKMSEIELYRLAVELPVAEELTPWSIKREASPTKLLALAKRYKVDAVKIRRKAEEALKEAEGGTRREVKPDSPKKPVPVKKAGALAKPANPKTPAKTATGKKATPKKKPAPQKKK